MAWLPPTPLLAAFGMASLILAVAPGPGVLYIVARSLAQGPRAGLASVAGVATGNLGCAMGAALGLAALVALSSLAFTVVKFAGAAYLVFLGVKMLRQRDVRAPAALGAAGVRRVFRDGFWVALLNPKTAIFFAAFLPQFVSPQGSPMRQSLALGAGFVAIAALTDSVYALAASALAPRLRREGQGATAGWGRVVSGCTLIGLGLFTALTGSRAAR